MKNVKYQSVKVDFPENLYLAANWLYTDNGKVMIYAHHELFPDAKKAIKAAKKLFTELTKRGDRALEYMLLLPLKFIEKIPLDKKYWENPTYKYEGVNRMIEINRLFLKNSGYKLLVTPYNAKKNILTAAISFLESATKEDLELFMSTSDWVVDIHADCSAFYLPRETMGLNFITGEIVDKNKPKNSESLPKIN